MAAYLALLEQNGSRLGRKAAGLRQVCRSVVTRAAEWAQCPCTRHAGPLKVDTFKCNDCLPECCWAREDYAGQVIAIALNVVAESAGARQRCATSFTTIPEMVSKLARAPESSLVAEAVLAVERAIRAEIVPWILGYGDPLRDRIEASRREQPD
jgi:hypothetical protein